MENVEHCRKFTQFPDETGSHLWKTSGGRERSLYSRAVVVTKVIPTLDALTDRLAHGVAVRGHRGLSSGVVRALHEREWSVEPGDPDVVVVRFAERLPMDAAIAAVASAISRRPRLRLAAREPDESWTLALGPLQGDSDDAKPTFWLRAG